MCRLEHESPVVKWVIKNFYLRVRSCLTFCSGGSPHTGIPLGVLNSLPQVHFFVSYHYFTVCVIFFASPLFSKLSLFYSLRYFHYVHIVPAYHWASPSE